MEDHVSDDAPEGDVLFDSHRELYEFLDLDHEDELLRQIFDVVAAFSDPKTQPEDTDEIPLTIECLADCSIALSYQWLLKKRSVEDTQDQTPAPEPVQPESLRFTLLLRFFGILRAISEWLKVDDELLLRFLVTDEEDWRKTAQYWLPTYDDDHILKLGYYMSCVLVMAIHKLTGQPVYLSPYASFLLRLWKAYSSIVAIALETDRHLEEAAWAKEGEYFDMPTEVKKALLGASVVRAVLAYVLNSDHEEYGFTADPQLAADMKELPMLEYFDPISRSSQTSGSLVVDQRLVAQVLMAYRFGVNFSPFERTEDYLYYDTVPTRNSDVTLYRGVLRGYGIGEACDLNEEVCYNDHLDEEIKYVFGYYDSDINEGDDDAASKDPEDAFLPFKNEVKMPDDGTDWRDILRDENVDPSPEFLQLYDKYKEGESDDFFDSWPTMLGAFEELASTSALKFVSGKQVLHDVGRVTINTLAKMIFERSELDLAGKAVSFLARQSPPEFRGSWSAERTNVLWFEHIMRQNPSVAFALADEIFMIVGMRRSFIWFLTHSINLHPTLVEYIYQLAVGERGDCAKRHETGSPFSRKGALKLSTIERLMLLHEFFERSAVWLYLELRRANSFDFKQIIIFFSLMIKMLISKKVVSFVPDEEGYFEDYLQDILTLLFPWIGKFPEAREVFFEVRQHMYTSSAGEGTAKLGIHVSLELSEAHELAQKLHDLFARALKQDDPEASSGVIEFMQNLQFVVKDPDFPFVFNDDVETNLLKGIRQIAEQKDSETKPEAPPPPKTAQKEKRKPKKKTKRKARR